MGKRKDIIKLIALYERMVGENEKLGAEKKADGNSDFTERVENECYLGFIKELKEILMNDEIRKAGKHDSKRIDNN